MNNVPVDLVVVGAGPAGMAAACQARAQGLTVVVLDEQPALGGQIYRRIESAPEAIQHILGADYVAGRALAREFKASGAIHITGAVVWNVAASGEINYIANGHNEDIVGKYVVLASGAMERPFPIKGWTLPGVMGAGAGQIMLKGAGALPTEPVVLAGCGPLLYLLAWQYLRAGVAIKALVDTTPQSAYVRALREAAGALKGWRDLAKGMKLLATWQSWGTMRPKAFNSNIAGSARPSRLLWCYCIKGWSRMRNSASRRAPRTIGAPSNFAGCRIPMSMDAWATP